MWGGHSCPPLLKLICFEVPQAQEMADERAHTGPLPDYPNLFSAYTVFRRWANITDAYGALASEIEIFCYSS